jgi:hypothetical protein
MDHLKQLILNNWQQKLVAVIAASVIWFFVNQSITDTKTISNVPIRVINIPEDKTISFMQPNGIIPKRIPLTLSGSKDVIHALEPGDLEVLLDASGVQDNEWIVQISKKNLVSLNPTIDLSRHISDVKHPEFVLKFNQLMTASVPVKIKTTGHPPRGYTYLDTWPQELKQTITGPQEQVQELMNEQLEIEIDMDKITKADLDKIDSSKENFHDDEVSFFIPAHWKTLSLPFKGGMTEELNDPEGQNLHIDFLRQQYLPIERDIAIRPFYPLVTLDSINPVITPILPDEKVKVTHGVAYLSMPLLVRDVSPLFLEIVRDYLEIIILAQPGEAAPLKWSLQVVDPDFLEEKYVNALISHSLERAPNSKEPRHTRKRENHLRSRFRSYLKNMTLYSLPDRKLQLDARLQQNGISIVPASL